MFGIDDVLSFGAPLLGGLLGGNASNSAANAQAQAAKEAEAGLNRRFDITRQDQLPFMRTGQNANAMLAHLMGLGGEPAGVDRAALRQQLLGKYTTGGGTGGEWYKTMYQGDGPAQEIDAWRPTKGDATVDETGLNAEIEQLMKSGSFDPNTAGALTRKFSMGDLNADPVYQSGLKFGLDQGTAGVNERAARSGMMDSGATLKALTRFANDYGSTKANESYNRFNTDQTNLYNRYAGLSGAGQQATNQVGAQNMATGGQIAGLQTDAGNARAAGIMGGANAWGGALSGLSEANNQSNSRAWLKKLMNGTGYGTGYGGLNPNSGEYMGSLEF